MSPSDFDIELKDLYERSVSQLMTDYFDAAAFEALYQHLCRKAELIKSDHVISKQVPHCLLSAQQTIESRSAHLPAACQHLEMARKFASLLGLIAIGEGCNDRVPGVPRVI